MVANPYVGTCSVSFVPKVPPDINWNPVSGSLLSSVEYL
jgi:hypothetical protein